MEVIDSEREEEWLEQMDAILIFVCLAFFIFRSDVLIYQTQMMRNSGLEPYVPAIPASMTMVVSRLLFTPLGPDQPGCASGRALTDPTRQNILVLLARSTLSPIYTDIHALNHECLVASPRLGLSPNPPLVILSRVDQ